LDQFGDFGADHMCAEELAGLFVENHFDKALIFAERDCLTITDEGEATDAGVELFLLSGLLGETDRGDLRRTIGATRN
jgi:hypothetical protein